DSDSRNMNLKVKDLWDIEYGCWNMSLLKALFDDHSTRQILKIHWLGAQVDDVAIWTGSSNGKFSVKTAYLLDQRHRFNVPVTKCWRNIWTSKIHERLKVSLWRVAAETLPLKWGLVNQLKLLKLSPC
ncbi:hypothetical protein TorRG33x02_044430, partial [Trema orientale]